MNLKGFWICLIGGMFQVGFTFAQVNFSQQSGGFGPYIGLVKSHFGQIQQNGKKQNLSQMYQGWEAGLKTELYRSKWMRGNIMAGYIQMGSIESVEAENQFTSVMVERSALKLALNPILFKVGSDFLHGYFGGGIYGIYSIKDEINNTLLAEQLWTGELSQKDIGLDLSAGLHIWYFDIEAHAQYGLLDQVTRLDGSSVRQQFYGLSIAYLWVNQHLTVKSCRDHKNKTGKGFY